MAIAQPHEEEKNRRIAAGVSVGMHVLLLLFLIYMLAWRAPDPPAPEYGIELNFGMDAVGSGDVQTTAAANESKNVEDSKPAPTQPDPLPEPEPVAKVTPPSPPQPVETPKVTTTTAEAPVSVKEVVKPEPKPQPKKEEVKPQPKAEPVEEVVKKEPEKPKSLYPGKPTTSTGTGKNGSSDEATGNNNGDDDGAVGDKGDPEGKVDAKALYGKAGGGAGGSLDMPGWRYDIEPKKDPYSNETGLVKFSIKIDADGNLTGVTVLESNVSPQVVAWYKQQLQKTTFSRTGSGANSSGASGVVTFRITSR
jgi:outer membrane biosynthesis protein TonB